MTNKREPLILKDLTEEEAEEEAEEEENENENSDDYSYFRKFTLH